jgi:hypothetical protein
MSLPLKSALLTVTLGMGLLFSAKCFAYAPDSELMKIKGYSPEVIQVADQQRSRQEWREPSTIRQSPVERFFHNIYYGEWTNGVDDFGNQVIRSN